MFKKILLFPVCLAIALVVSGCTAGSQPSKTAASSGAAPAASGDVTSRTDYVIYYKNTNALPIGGITTHTFIIGNPVPEASTIKKNAYLVPWRINFSQVQLTDNLAAAMNCRVVKEQALYIEGYIEMNLANAGITAASLPTFGPLVPSGTVHETVTGEAGTWACSSDFLTKSFNQGSIDAVNTFSGTHDASFKDASNLTDLKVSGANVYLDLTMSGKIMFIWPAGTKIEYAPAGTPIPLAPLPPNQL